MASLSVKRSYIGLKLTFILLVILAYFEFFYVPETFDESEYLAEAMFFVDEVSKQQKLNFSRDHVMNLQQLMDRTNTLSTIIYQRYNFSIPQLDTSFENADYLARKGSVADHRRIMVEYNRMLDIAIQTNATRDDLTRFFRQIEIFGFELANLDSTASNKYIYFSVEYIHNENLPLLV